MLSIKYGILDIFFCNCGLGFHSWVAHKTPYKSGYQTSGYLNFYWFIIIYVHFLYIPNSDLLNMNDESSVDASTVSSQCQDIMDESTPTLFSRLDGENIISIVKTEQGLDPSTEDTFLDNTPGRRTRSRYKEAEARGDMK